MKTIIETFKYNKPAGSLSRQKVRIDMKYNYKIYEDHKKVVLEGTTSGRGTRKEQEEEVRLEAMKAGYKTRLDERYSLKMKATTLY